MPDLIVTNFNRNFTGVSATAAGVVRHHVDHYDLVLSGHPLPGCPPPVNKAKAARLSRHAPSDKPFTIWHVRRNTEMRHALWVRDVLRHKVRIVFTSAAIRRHSALPRWLISRMDAVIATTEAAASFVPNVRAVAPHGVDTNVFTPADDRAAAWTATGFPGRCGIATIGRIRPEKGTDRFVETMLHFLPHNPEATALVIGRAARRDQSFLDNLKRKIEAAGLTERILFPGEIDANALPGVIRGLSALVQLPRYEGYGMTPLEAMASAVPFVATDQGYFRSFAGQGQCGVIVPEDQSDNASEALRALLDDTDRHGAIARAARDSAVHHFSVAQEADCIGQVYEEMWAEAL